MIYGTNEDRKRFIEKKIEAKQGMIRFFPIVKKVIQEFDGKCYNCKLDAALKEAAATYDLDHWITKDNRAGVYCHINYHDWIEITAYINNESVDLFYMRKDELKDGKRIDASVWLENINRHYEQLMKDINNLKRDLETIDSTLEQIEILKKQLNALVAPLSWTTRDAYNIHRITI